MKFGNGQAYRKCVDIFQLWSKCENKQHVLLPSGPGSNTIDSGEVSTQRASQSQSIGLLQSNGSNPDGLGPCLLLGGGGAVWA
jgi:hypothetical protein